MSGDACWMELMARHQEKQELPENTNRQICDVYDWIYEKGSPYIIMHYR